MGDVAVFTLDRSLTGQDARDYPSAPMDAEDPIDRLARRILADPDVTRVHVLSNVVTVTRTGDWGVGEVNTARDAIATMFVHYGAEEPERLREKHYNATITQIRAHNPDLWVMRVEPDESPREYEPGQYTSLGLGYWEPRSDEADEPFDPRRHDRMALRSYSVSSSIVDGRGNLLPRQGQDYEFYIVKVRPGQTEIPALTPRLFLKEVGDRIYMGRRFAGRYTLAGVAPEADVVFLSTGTGEAPQNAMTAELLGRAHRGRILNMVCVRYRRDLAYLDQQELVESRWATYRYHAFTTREPGDEKNKAYIQDLLLDGTVEELLGKPLHPETTQFFLCGNPAMIGLPRRDDDGNPHFPETLGVAQILHDRGFTLDHRRERGNVHYEEYWKERASAEA